jgi:hypothetical protein
MIWALYPLVISLPIFAFLGMMMVRNRWVHAARQRFLNEASTLAKQDIAHGRRWQWRYDTLDHVTYDQMMWRFWIWDAEKFRPQGTLNITFAATGASS